MALDARAIASRMQRINGDLADVEELVEEERFVDARAALARTDDELCHVRGTLGVAVDGAIQQRARNATFSKLQHECQRLCKRYNGLRGQVPAQQWAPSVSTSLDGSGLGGSVAAAPSGMADSGLDDSAHAGTGPRHRGGGDVAGQLSTLSREPSLHELDAEHELQSELRRDAQEIATHAAEMRALFAELPPVVQEQGEHLAQVNKGVDDTFVMVDRGTAELHEVRSQRCQGQLDGRHLLTPRCAGS